MVSETINSKKESAPVKKKPKLDIPDFRDKHILHRWLDDDGKLVWYDGNVVGF